MCSSCGCKSAEGVKKNCGCGQDPCKTYGAEDWQTNDEFWEYMYLNYGEKFDNNGHIEMTNSELRKIAKKQGFAAETTMTVEHKDGSKYRYSETDPIYGEMGEIVGHVSEITDEQDTPYQKIYGRDVTREHNFYHAESENVHCSFCSKIIGTEKEVYDEETIDYEVANGETICVSCGEEREKELKNDLDPHYSPFYAETFEAQGKRNSIKTVKKKGITLVKGKLHTIEEGGQYDKAPSTIKFELPLDEFIRRLQGSSMVNYTGYITKEYDAEYHRDSKGRFAEKPLLTGSVISGLALGLIYLMRGK